MRSLDRDPADDGARCFFVHIMKTGGTTLLWHLRDTLPRGQLFPDRDADIRSDGPRVDVRHHLSVAYLVGLPPERRAQIRLYAGHFPYVAYELLAEDLVTMTLVREPISRTISLLRQFRRPAPWAEPTHPAPLATKTLEEVYDDPRIHHPLIRNHQTKIFSMTAADRPESYMQVLDVDEKRLAVAKHNLDRVDLVGLTERYDDFLDEVRDRLGWAVPRDERLNAAPEETSDGVSPEFERRIAADNAIDVEFYDYARQLVSARKRTTR